MKKALTLLLATLSILACSSPAGIDKESFASPAKDHYPQTWFHFIGNNVSLEGITADLEAIAQADISGVQFFHGYQGNNKWPEVGEGIAPLSENWDDAVKHIAQECSLYADPRRSRDHRRRLLRHP